MKISIINRNESELTKYAAKELKCFISQYSNSLFDETNREEADRYYILEVSNDIDEYSYRIKGSKYRDKPAVIISGGADNSLLTGVYEMLRRMGIYFHCNGHFLSKTFSFSNCDKTDETITPYCRNRGIRQHINFPMDISSYRLKEAQEYIENLARMGMNSITFHSYTNQWHGYKTSDKEILAGHFFYGKTHSVPKDKELSKVIENRKIYCIPEVESIYDDEKAREEYAIYWLNEVIRTAKNVGIKVTLSIEFPPNESQETLIQIAKNVVRNYPEIDMMEWITPEGGEVEGDEHKNTDIRSMAIEMFGDSILKNGDIPYIPSSLPSALIGTMINLKRAVDLYSHRDEIFKGVKSKRIQIGLYVMCSETLRFVKYIMEQVLPEEVVHSFLPAHGSNAVADNIKTMNFTDSNWQKTMVYSWIEYDGIMYMQQNSNNGIEKLIYLSKEETKQSSIYGMCFNHWRTEENTMTIAYAAQAMIKPLKVTEFYKEFAQTYSIKNIEIFADAMNNLGQLDTFNRDNFFGIGFCYLGCWLNQKGLGWIKDCKVKDLNYSINIYQKIIDDLYICLSDTSKEQGIALLRFLINRIKCSIIHLYAMLELKSISEFADDNESEKLTEDQKDEVIKYCAGAMKHAREYMKLHSEMMPDRGCQGTLVSYDYTIPVYIKHIEKYFIKFEGSEYKLDLTKEPPAPDEKLK